MLAWEQNKMKLNNHRKENNNVTSDAQRQNFFVFALLLRRIKFKKEQHKPHTIHAKTYVRLCEWHELWSHFIFLVFVGVHSRVNHSIYSD